MRLDAREVGILVGAVVLVTLLVARAIRNFVRGVRARRRMKRARRGETRAEKLLRKRGYRVEGRQVPTRFTFHVDGTPRDVELRADLLVRRSGRRYVAEVKTGTLAPDPGHRATRRQLLEYAVAFDADGLLLVDADRGNVHEVVFPL